MRISFREPVRRLDLDAELRRATYEAVQPVTLLAALVLTLLLPFAALHHRAVLTVAWLLHHIAATGALFLVARAARGGRLWIEAHAPAAGAAIALVVTSVVAHLQLLSGDPLVIFDLVVVIIGVGCLVLSTAWMAIAIALCVAAWLPFAWIALPAPAIVDCLFVLATAAAVAVAVHVTRRRTHIRLAVLHHNDSARKGELEEALAAAEVARTELDGRVDERTRALALAYEELQRELDERQRVERERHVLEERLHHAQRLESLGRLAGGVAHDFNNLLSVVMGNAELISDEPDLGPGVRESANEILSAAERAAEVTRQLLAFGRKQMISPRVIELRRVVDDLVRMVRRTLGEDLVFEVEVDDDVPAVLADARQLEQALMNLVVNARDAMPTGGRVVISVGAANVGPALAARFPSAKPGHHAVLRVRDGGAGMDEATLGAIWEPFFTTKPAGKGTGLGLPMVHGIVTQHGGFIDVSSEVGAGSCFAVYLPATDGTPVTVSTVRPREGAPTGCETVLVVEDAAAVRRLAVGGLRQLGYQVLEAADGDEALRVAGDHVGPIHLLVTDVVMPGIDGAKLADRLRVGRAELCVLFASGYDDSRLGKAGILPEHVDFLAKPYDARTLGTRVREVLDRRAARAVRAATG